MRFLALAAGLFTGLFMPAVAYAKMMEQERQTAPARPMRSTR